MARRKPTGRPKTRTVLDRLRSEIKDGSLAPGTRLRQARIAELHGVSITPVREAFAALEREGLVQSNAHRGVVVFMPSVKDVRELFELRIPLEAKATELAVPNLTQSDLELLSRYLEEIAESHSEGDSSRGDELDREFHGHIYAASNRRQLVELISELQASSHAYSHRFAAVNPRVDESRAEHESIYLACAAGAPRRAAKAVEEHLRSTLGAVTKQLWDS